MRHESATTFTVSPGTGDFWREMRRPGRIALLVVALLALVVEFAAGWYSFEEDDPGSGLVFVVSIGAVVLVTCGLSLVYGVLFWRNSRLVLTPDEIVHRNWRGRTRRLPRDRVAEVTKARYLADSNGIRNGNVLTVIAATDGRTVSFATAYWPEEELAELWRRLGAPCGTWLDPAVPTMREFRRSHRVRLPVYHRHFTGFTMLVGGAIAVALIAVTTILVVAFG
ncbi:hypothetical protein DFP74_5208 [Nocardiopsis sp. Huas11]|uniref:hypothetical protein n=1 Tax=Nocardiopsis sp. Huas11 TaxID=2183912 RepID=UPI000EACF2C9|nr:hypothetical protein [Nocardiopsis sp. Huas11]RKS09469.1 hypothetical protein DFP74_5208 [Nocardiopsis sp. Huas11]